MAKRASLKANFGYNLIYNILNIVVPLITAPYTSRVLGAANIGIYSYTYSIISSVIMFSSLGAATYGQKEIASIRSNETERTCVFWEIFCLKAVTTTIAILIFFPIAYSSAQFEYFLLQSPFLIAAIFDIGWFFQGMEQFKYIAIRNIMVRIASVVLLLLLVKNQNDLWIYLLIISLSQLGGNWSMWTYLKKNVKSFKFRSDHIKEHLSGLMVYFIPTIAYQIYSVLDKTMLGILVGSDYENGYYEQAYKIINMIVTVITAYTVVMRSRMSFLFANKEFGEIKNKIRKSSDIIAFLSFPMTFGLAAVAEGMVPWFFGDGYDRVVSLLYAFCPIFICMGYSHLIGTHLLTPSGRQMKSNIAQIAAAVFNIILNAILIPKLYSIGAAIASVTSEIVIMIIYFCMVGNEFRPLDALKTAWKKLISAVVMFVTVSVIEERLTISIWSSMIEVGVGVVVYVLTLLVLHDSFITTELKEMSNKFLRRA